MIREPNGSKERESKQYKGRKPSSAANNVAQVRAKKGQHEETGSIAQTRVEQVVAHDTGELALIAIFLRNGGLESHRVDLSFLLAFPNLQPMFTDAFLSWGAVKSPSTRRDCRDYLRRHFFAYLMSDWTRMLHPGDIDDELLAGFRDSLVNSVGGRGKALHPSTVGHALSVLRSILGQLNTGPWACVANHIAELVPSRPVGAGRKTKPTEVLGMESLLAIIAAAEREVLVIEQRFAKARVLLVDGRILLREPSRVISNTHADYSDFAVCLAAVDKAYPGVIPDLKVLIAKSNELGCAVQFTHGHGAITSHLYTSGRDLVPFVLLLAFTTVFNSDTILSLNWQDIDINKDHVGIPAIEIVGAKGRADRDMVRLLDPNSGVSSSLNLKNLLVSLKEITLRIRPHLAPEHADRVFVFVQQVGGKQPKGFGTDSAITCLPSSDVVWMRSLKRFIIDNKLPPFTLNQLRPTILDLVQFMDGSLEAARKVGNHGSQVVTWTHYTSGGVKARYRERIGQVIVLRERWLQTGGVIDPRRLTPGQDKGAATPGFSCLDPFDSPRPNQKPGRLCKDYGGCPSCPMAAAHPSDPLCVGYYTALEAAIYRSQSTMSARTWIERWTPVLSDLGELRAWIPPSVLVASREIAIRLPNVG